MATLLQVYRSLFPDESRRKVFESTPRLPTDAFAFSGNLVERSGAIIMSRPRCRREDGDHRRILVEDAMRLRAVIRITVSQLSPTLSEI